MNKHDNKQAVDGATKGKAPAKGGAPDKRPNQRTEANSRAAPAETPKSGNDLDANARLIAESILGCSLAESEKVKAHKNSTLKRIDQLLAGEAERKNFTVDGIKGACTPMELRYARKAVENAAASRPQKSSYEAFEKVCDQIVDNCRTAIDKNPDKINEIKGAYEAKIRGVLGAKPNLSQKAIGLKRIRFIEGMAKRSPEKAKKCTARELMRIASEKERAAEAVLGAGKPSRFAVMAKGTKEFKSRRIADAYDSGRAVLRSFLASTKEKLEDFKAFVEAETAQFGAGPSDDGRDGRPSTPDELRKLLNSYFESIYFEGIVSEAFDFGIIDEHRGWAELMTEGSGDEELDAVLDGFDDCIDQAYEKAEESYLEKASRRENLAPQDHADKIRSAVDRVLNGQPEAVSGILSETLLKIANAKPDPKTTKVTPNLVPETPLPKRAKRAVPEKLSKVKKGTLRVVRPITHRFRKSA